MAAIFDMDGLLFDTDPVLWVESMYEVAKAHGIDISTDLLRHTKGLRIYEVTEFWNERFGWHDAARAQMIAEDIIDDIIARTIRKGKIMPGVLPLLEDFTQHQVHLGVATSSPARMVHQLLDHFALSTYFKAICSADTCVQGKPHPEVYLQCASALNALPWKCVAFEDSVNGMIAAKAARMILVAVPERTQINSSKFGLADQVLSSLEDFSYADYIRLLEA
ncbi:hexitol phosphatase HxpB [Taibaiella sp. KBW10]|uniref:hexitol phosphatase HxpB n=1 Tax=Taibaiella sp. KBW10 TaxID=2153357 RepID=UPI000F5A05A4|nr:hexitol phosphatase HxpB [Taibaiella sp. KBW10]RQO31891.1 hexitol phosphatase HxpB [Taibaiella sp. KBW10]